MLSLPRCTFYLTLLRFDGTNHFLSATCICTPLHTLIYYTPSYLSITLLAPLLSFTSHLNTSFPPSVRFVLNSCCLVFGFLTQHRYKHRKLFTPLFNSRPPFRVHPHSFCVQQSLYLRKCYGYSNILFTSNRKTINRCNVHDSARSHTFLTKSI